MKNRIHLVFVIAIFALSFSACNMQSSEKEKKTDQSESAQNAGSDTLLKPGNAEKFAPIPFVPIKNHEWALACLKRYDTFLYDHIKPNDETPGHTPKTKEMVFDKVSLINWITNLGNQANYIAVRFAKYQDESDQDSYPVKENARGVTVLLWPYADKYTPVSAAPKNYPFMSYKNKGKYEYDSIDNPKKDNWAKKCITRYETFFDNHKISGDDESKELDPANNKPKYTTKTTEVVFEKGPLLDWLNSNELKNTTDSIHFQFGRYQNEDEPDQRGPDPRYNHNPHSRRLTVFLWPYKNGNPATTTPKIGDGLVDPYNLGEIHP